MAETFLPSEFNKVADFGTTKSVENQYTGISIPKFVSLFKLHYKPHTRTLNQQYQATQAKLDDTKVIIVRHNKKLTESLLVTIDGIQYSIVSISPDEGFGLNKYDYITLRKTNKVG